MKPVDKNVVIKDEEPADDDATILSSTSRAQAKKDSSKKSLTGLWWAILIAAIVAVAAWLSLYAFTGKSGHGDSQQPNVTEVQEVKPIKPIPHHDLVEGNTRSASRKIHATNSDQTSKESQQEVPNNESSDGNED